MDKSKDFVGSMKRLFKELKSFQILIAMALIFAILSSILSIAAPNKLSKLTDTISEGLIVNLMKCKKLVRRLLIICKILIPKNNEKYKSISRRKTNFHDGYAI